MKDRPTRFEWEVSRIEKRFSERQSAFQNIMKTAAFIEENHPAALKDLIRILGLKMQAEFILHPLLYESPVNLPFDPYEEWFSVWCGKKDRSFVLTPDGKDFYDLGRPTRQTHVISLARDVVIPNRFYSTQLGQVLSGLPCSRNSFDNYYGWIWEPVGVVMLEDKNCFVTPRLLRRAGEIEIHLVYDFSAVYEYVHCDGDHFVRSWDGKKIAPVYDPAFAAIFEIGRMILKQRNR